MSQVKNVDSVLNGVSSRILRVIFLETKDLKDSGVNSEETYLRTAGDVFEGGEDSSLPKNLGMIVEYGS